MIVKPYKDFVPLRVDNQPDGRDGDRLNFLKREWSRLDELYRPYNRQVEENLRFLAGQQWSVYHPVLGVWLDVTDWMTEDEKRWRVRPIINRMLPWYIVQHARATENPPIITFLPGPDRIDAELAEVLDIAHKALWREMNMEDVHDRLMGWVLAAGRGHLMARIDAEGGDMKPWVGEDMVPVVDAYDQPVQLPDGRGPAMAFMQGVPFNERGEPMMVARQVAPDQYEPVQTGEPHMEPEGTIRTDVLSPLQVRGSWGPDPWHQKRRHFARLFLTPEEVWERFEVDCAPDVKGNASDVTELERVLFGTGFYGAINLGLNNTQTADANTDGYCEVTAMWEAPAPIEGMMRRGEEPGGRWLVCTQKKVLRDGPRPVAFPYTSPIHTFEFVRLPGRQNGTTPAEILVPLQRSLNQNDARIGEHCNLVTNPKGVIDAQSGMKPGQMTNRPGDNYVLNRRPGVPAIEYVAPPPLSQDVYRLRELLIRDFQELGNLTQQFEGPVPTNASGELIKELRFDDDRYLGPTMRRGVSEYGRYAETLRCMQALVWDAGKVIQYAGEDNIARVVTVMPMMYQKGKVNVVPDMESMLPEGRGERQKRVYAMYMDGLLGLPGSPEALQKFYEIAHFPHLSRTAKPGGVHTITAQQHLGRILQGEPPQQIPVYEWYDPVAHLAVFVQYMASPEFEKTDPVIQEALVFHYRALNLSMQMKQQQALAQAAAQEALLNPQPSGPPSGKKGKAEPSSEPVTQPTPEPPRGGVPGGRMPTAVTA